MGRCHALMHRALERERRVSSWSAIGALESFRFRLKRGTPLICLLCRASYRKTGSHFSGSALVPTLHHLLGRFVEADGTTFDRVHYGEIDVVEPATCRQLDPLALYAVDGAEVLSVRALHLHLLFDLGWINHGCHLHLIGWLGAVRLVGQTASASVRSAGSQLLRNADDPRILPVDLGMLGCLNVGTWRLSFPGSPVGVWLSASSRSGGRSGR